MIFVQRTNPPIQLRVDAENEIALAKKHFEIDNKKTPFQLFNTYSKPYVKEALRKLFNKKCAYCESFLTHIEHPHIEHWRPKGGVTEQKDHNGYYWLAADWGNLLYACGVCNTNYKGNKFPLEEGSVYAVKSDDKHQIIEKPLLINPCIDNPELFLDFTDEGTIYSIDQSLKGVKSIEIYGLDREDLNFVRKFHATQTIKNRLDDMIEDINDFDGNEEKLLKRTKRNLDDLKCYFCSDVQFIALSRSIIRRYRTIFKDLEFFMEVTKELVEETKVLQ